MSEAGETHPVWHLGRRTAGKLTPGAQNKNEPELFFDALIEPVIIYDCDGSPRRVNQAAIRSFGFNPTGIDRLSMLRKIRAHHPDGRPVLVSELPSTRALRGKTVIGERFIFANGEGRKVAVQVSATPLYMDGVITGAIAVWHDITEREQKLDQVKRERSQVQELIGTLERERDTLQVIMESTNAHIAYLDSQFNFIMVNSTYAKGSGHTKEELIGKNHFELFPNVENEAVFKKVRDTGEAIEYKTKPFVYADQPWRGTTYWDWRLTPIKDTSGRVAGLVLSLVDTTETIRAKQLSDALNRINADISSTLDFEEIIKKVVVETTTAIGAETGAIALHDDGSWAIKHAHGLPERLPGVQIISDSELNALLAIKNNKPIVVNDAFSDSRVSRERMREHGIRSVMVVPLIVRDEVIGVILYNYHSAPVKFTDTQVDFASKLAASVSLALENVRIYQAERHIADTLQEALLAVPQKIEGINFSYLYRSSTEAAKVGGDFYDVFEIGDGKIGIVVGDISGKGVEAAAITAVVKTAIKAYAYGNDSPSLTMTKTNDLLLKSALPVSFITVFFGVLDTQTGRLMYCSAGHLPAIIKRVDGTVGLLDVNSPFVGAFSKLKYSDAEDIIYAGDVLIMYTDGIIEARCNDGFFGMERLFDFVRKLESLPADELPKNIFAEVMACTGSKLADDVVLIAISLEETGCFQ